MFSDVFQIVQQQNRALNIQVSQDQYEQLGKRVIYEYFIDTLLGEQPKKIRKCAKIQVIPIRPITMVTKTSASLRGLLLQMKCIIYLSLTNLVKFVKALLTVEIRSKFSQEIAKLCQLAPKDKLNYINLVKTIICNQKCPCCGRICGIENDHQYHKCLYGHQMRGLNGTYILRENNGKEASVVRCQQLSESDVMKYNGKQYTWVEFKQYWKGKSPGGWLFDDANLNNNTNQLRFEQAWTIAGPVYCKKYGLIYVPFNKAQIQKAEAKTAPVHYIFALDESGSMSGDRWTKLMKSFNEVLQKIKQMDANKNVIKVSVIKFDDTSTVVQQNANPTQISTNLSCRGGGTVFDPPFNSAASLAARYINNTTIVFIFMTDGGAAYPSAGIQALQRLQTAYPNKLNYAGIQFDSNQSVMKTIASQLKGKTGVAYTPQQLTELFKKSVQIIEYRQGQ